MSSTIVIVDDNSRFRSTARALLELDGFDVVGEAADAAGGVETVARLRPDVVLLDIALPDASGLDVAPELAQTATVVLVSSRGRQDIGARLDRCGAAGFIAKDELTGDALAELLR